MSYDKETSNTTLRRAESPHRVGRRTREVVFLYRVIGGTDSVFKQIITIETATRTLFKYGEKKRNKK